MHPIATDTTPIPDELIGVEAHALIDQIEGLLYEHPEKLSGFAQIIVRLKLDEALTLVAKQLDYGPGNIANPPGAITPQVALTVRLSDKINRLGNLLSSGLEPQNEAVEDTWLDVANYGTIGAMLEEGSWPTVHGNGRGL